MYPDSISACGAERRSDTQGDTEPSLPSTALSRHDQTTSQAIGQCAVAPMRKSENCLNSHCWKTHPMFPTLLKKCKSERIVERVERGTRLGMMLPIK